MSTPSPCFDPAVLRRYDIPGPRYTSYPTAPQFLDDFSEGDLRRWAFRSNVRSIPRPLSVYVHVPYCPSPCFYCACNRSINRSPQQGDHYVERLLQEVRLVASLFDARREVIQLHLGGGTPNFLRPAQLTRLMGGLARGFRLGRSVDRDFSIELDPRLVRAGDIEALAQLGFNRVSLGVQDFDARVQRAINRVQSVYETFAVIEACRVSGMRSINVDLIYGLPLQTLEGFEQTLDTVIVAHPERIAVYAYAHMPAIFKAQRQIRLADLPGPEARLALLRLAIGRLGAAGYHYIGMDHFARPEDDLARAQQGGCLQRTFMGYTTHVGCDLIGLGPSAISHVGDSYTQNHRQVAEWESALDRNCLPVARGIELDADDLVRAELIQQLMCYGEIDLEAIERQHGIVFGDYFCAELRQLESLITDGLLRIEPKRIRTTELGRLLSRAIASCFDRYLTATQTANAGRPRFSKVV